MSHRGHIPCLLEAETPNSIEPTQPVGVCQRERAWVLPALGVACGLRGLSPVFLVLARGRAHTCLFLPGSEDTSWKTATLPEAVPAATRSSKQLRSFTAVMDSVRPWGQHKQAALSQASGLVRGRKEPRGTGARAVSSSE